MWHSGAIGGLDGKDAGGAEKVGHRRVMDYCWNAAVSLEDPTGVPRANIFLGAF